MSKPSLVVALVGGLLLVGCGMPAPTQPQTQTPVAAPPTRLDAPDTLTLCRSGYSVANGRC
ncbi:MAG: hypothetical protein ABJE47_12850 [bacterium]